MLQPNISDIDPSVFPMENINQTINRTIYLELPTILEQTAHNLDNLMIWCILIILSYFVLRFTLFQIYMNVIDVPLFHDLGNSIMNMMRDILICCSLFLLYLAWMQGNFQTFHYIFIGGLCLCFVAGFLYNLTLGRKKKKCMEIGTDSDEDISITGFFMKFLKQEREKEKRGEKGTLDGVLDDE